MSLDPSHIKALFDERQNAASELRSLYTDSADRELTGEETATEERLDGALGTLDERIAVALKGMERDSKAEAAAIDFRNAHPEVFQNAAVATSFDSDPEETMLRQLVEGTIQSATFDRYEQREGLTTAAAFAGNVIPGFASGNFHSRLLEYMIEVSSVMQGGAWHLDTGTGEEIVMPAATGFPTALIIAEAASATVSDPAFSVWRSKAQKFGFMQTVSTEMLRDSAINLTEFLSRTGGRALGHGVGAKLISGSGTNEPQGITAAVTGASIAVAAATGTAASANRALVDAIIDLQHSIIAPYRSGAVFLTHDSTVKVLRKLRDADSNFLFQGPTSVGGPESFLGTPILTDPSHPTFASGNKVMTYGNLAEGYVYRTVGGVRIDRSAEYAWERDVVAFRYLLTAGGNLTDPNAIRTLIIT